MTSQLFHDWTNSPHDNNDVFFYYSQNYSQILFYLENITSSHRSHGIILCSATSSRTHLWAPPIQTPPTHRLLPHMISPHRLLLHMGYSHTSHMWAPPKQTSPTHRLLPHMNSHAQTPPTYRPLPQTDSSHTSHI